MEGHRGRRSVLIVPWVVVVAASWMIAGGGGYGHAQGPLTSAPSGSALARSPITLAPSFPPRAFGRFGAEGSVISPGQPRRGDRPTPGSLFDPGASGPGIGDPSREQFLGGALDSRTGWPFVLLFHFRPVPERVERFWIVETRDCPQVMGSDPWPCLKVRHYDARGELVTRDPRELLAQTVGRPVFVQVQGSLTTPEVALGGLMWSQAWLTENGALPRDAVVIAFDWPSQRVYENDIQDVNEKGRRAYVAGYHLASFLQAFPPASRICILGQSYGGRVVPASLHLLGGGYLDSQDRDPPVRLPGVRPDLQLRAIILEGAADHFWLDPDQRFDRALSACEGFLNLYNRRDEALVLYPFLGRGQHHHAIGRVGLKPDDLERLGPLAGKYEEHDVHDLLGREHTLLDAVANRQIARWIAPYLWSPDPGPAPPRPNHGPVEEQRRPSMLRRILGR